MMNDIKFSLDASMSIQFLPKGVKLLMKNSEKFLEISPKIQVNQILTEADCFFAKTETQKSM